MEQYEDWEELCEELKKKPLKRSVRQTRLLLMEIGTHLNMDIDERKQNLKSWKISRDEAIRDEIWFNKTLDQIERLSRLIYWKLDNLDVNESDSSACISYEDLDYLLKASAYIHNLVRKVETVGECTGTKIRGPKI